MDRVDYESLVIQDLLTLHRQNSLNLTPWYQRRSVWSDPQKSYLINTIFSGKPVPSVYMRHILDLARETTIKEVVDGQQRIRAVLDFKDDAFSFRHPGTMKKVKYSDLTKAEQIGFLMTKLSVGYLIGANDGDVIDIFGRINSVSKSLNDQEKRNAQFSGDFKQFCLSESSKRIEALKEFSLFSATDISRMEEVKFISELTLNLVKGVSDGSATAINRIYEEYDSDFPDWKKTSSRIDKVFGFIGSMNNVKIQDTIFKRPPLFLSLFLVLDRVGSITSAKLEKAVVEIDRRFNSDVPISDRPKKDSDFYLASTSSTQRIAQRKVRDKYISSFL